MTDDARLMAAAHFASAVFSAARAFSPAVAAGAFSERVRVDALARCGGDSRAARGEARLAAA